VPAYSTLEFNIEIIDHVKPGERDIRHEEILKEQEEKEEKERLLKEQQAQS